MEEGEERRVRTEEGPCFRDKENLGLHWKQEYTGPQRGCREARAAGRNWCFSWDASRELLARVGWSSNLKALPVP